MEGGVSWLVRLLGRRYNASAGVWSDQPVLAEQESSRSALMQVFILEPEELIYLNPMRTDWWMHLGNISASPIVAKKIEICNPTFGDLTFRLAIMAVEDGTPGTGNAFLAWDTGIGVNEVWRWDGELALAGRYLYGKASGAGLTILVEYVFGTG